MKNHDFLGSFEQLGRFPGMGGRVPEYDRYDIREVMERPYRIIYRVWPDRIEMLAVIHSARQLPAELP